MKILLFIVRLILSIRYKVKLSWVKHLKHDWPILLLPNHVALVDPRILISFLWKYLPVSPLASEKYYNKPILKQVMDLVWTVPIWEMEAWANPDEIKEIFEKIALALNGWKNILIYPSWQIYRQWYESIKGKQSVYNIVKLMPENTKVVWIRTRWLWWSIWSKAWDNWETSFFGIYLKCIWFAFANFIFLVPKRDVNIEIEDITNDINFYKNKCLNEFNWYLEKFYNNTEEEKINYIKHYFYYDDVKNRKEPDLITWSEKELNTVKKHDISMINEEVKNNIKNKITIIKWINLSSVTNDSNLVLDLYFDSLDVAEIKSYIQANFIWASNPPITDLKTVADLYVMAVWQSQNEEKLKECDWCDDGSLEIKNLVENIWNNKNNNNNLLLLWKQNFKKNKSDKFMWDNVFGMQSKKDFIIKAYLISDYIKKIPWDYVGIMLPAVWSASLIIISTYLAWKIPVMFNWTLWKEAFDHCVNFSKVNKILTSSNFYDRVKNDFLEEYNSNNIWNWKKTNFLFLEDLLKWVSLWNKIKALFKSFYMPIKDSSEIAVILFTSWSESLPKAVPLSHENLIENIKWSFELFELKTDDRLIWFLPPFHSFWFTINTIMPLITWLQVVYTPDPNDAKTILNIIKHAKVTTITATPTFLKMIMFLSKKDDLKNIRYSVVWAEKCSEEIFNKFNDLSPNWKILEWYGITECSPVVSINPINWAKPWTVWKIIPCLDCKIIWIDSQKEVKILEQWMIYVSGFSIFNWYLDSKLESPFEEINWKKYYKTWDLWFLDKEGFLTITWRLKRFIKIAWEMISLPFIEWILLEKYWNDKELKIAIEALEKDWNAKIVLFTIDNIELENVNTYLRDRWLSNLVKISKVEKVKEIPVLWTGKIDYKVLKKMISF